MHINTLPFSNQVSGSLSTLLSKEPVCRLFMAVIRVLLPSRGYYARDRVGRSPIIIDVILVQIKFLKLSPDLV